MKIYRDKFHPYVEKVDVIIKIEFKGCSSTYCEFVEQLNSENQLTFSEVWVKMIMKLGIERSEVSMEQWWCLFLGIVNIVLQYR
jgi:hypothetical protein